MSSQPSRYPPFRAEHIGSFPCPDELLHIWRVWNNKKATDAKLKVAEDKAMNQIVKL